jgi:hypothetical protein
LDIPESASTSLSPRYSRIGGLLSYTMSTVTLSDLSRHISDHKLYGVVSQTLRVSCNWLKDGYLGNFFSHRHIIPFETGTKTLTSLHPEMSHRDRIGEIPVLYPRRVPQSAQGSRPGTRLKTPMDSLLCRSVMPRGVKPNVINRHIRRRVDRSGKRQ